MASYQLYPLSASILEGRTGSHLLLSLSLTINPSQMQLKQGEGLNIKMGKKDSLLGYHKHKVFLCQLERSQTS